MAANACQTPCPTTTGGRTNPSARVALDGCVPVTGPARRRLPQGVDSLVMRQCVPTSPIQKPFVRPCLGVPRSRGMCREQARDDAPSGTQDRVPHPPRVLQHSRLEGAATEGPGQHRHRNVHRQSGLVADDRPPDRVQHPHHSGERGRSVWSRCARAPLSSAVLTAVHRWSSIGSAATAGSGPRSGDIQLTARYSRRIQRPRLRRYSSGSSLEEPCRSGALAPWISGMR